MPSKYPLGTPQVTFCFRARSYPAFLKVNAINFPQSSTEPQHSHCLPWLTSDITKKLLKPCDRSSFDWCHLLGKWNSKGSWVGSVSEEGFHTFLLRQRVCALHELISRQAEELSQAAGGMTLVCGRLLAPISPAEAVSFPHWGRQSLSGGWAVPQAMGAATTLASHELVNEHHGSARRSLPSHSWAAHWQMSRNQT